MSRKIIGTCLLLALAAIGASFFIPSPTEDTSEQRSGSSSAAKEPSKGWPNFWGPNHNNVSAETGIATEWPLTGPPEKWRRDVGRGYSSPVVRNGRLVVMHRRENLEIIECFDAESGETIWQFDYPTSYKCRYEYSDGPYSTPALDERHVYAVGAQGQLHCLSLETGDVVWSRMLHKEYDVEEPLFAVGASPLLEGDRLIFNLGARDDNAGIIAVDKQSGETLWAATDHGGCYATPCAATIHGQRYVFVVTFDGIVALDPADGRVFWSEEFRPKAPDSVNATSPVVDGDLVLMVTGPGPGCLCLRVLPGGKYEQAWRERRALDSQFNSLVCIDGYVYGYTSKRIETTLRCVDMKTGEVRWKWDSPLERGSAIAVDGRFILWGEHGHLGSLDVNHEQPVPHSMTAEPLLASPCYAAPALNKGLLFVRNEETLLCLNLRALKK